MHEDVIVTGRRRPAEKHSVGSDGDGEGRVGATQPDCPSELSGAGSGVHRQRSADRSVADVGVERDIRSAGTGIRVDGNVGSEPELEPRRHSDRYGAVARADILTGSQVAAECCDGNRPYACRGGCYPGCSSDRINEEIIGIHKSDRVCGAGRDLIDIITTIRKSVWSGADEPQLICVNRCGLVGRGRDI